MSNDPSKAARNLRAAIIGAGLMGRWHADAVRHIGGDVTVVVDRDSRKAAQLARRHPGARTAANMADVLKEKTADVAHICTPGETHEELTQQALEAGVHALVEKPLTEAADGTARLFRLADSSKLLLCPVHQLLFQPGVLRIQAAMKRIAPLLHVDTVICTTGAERHPNPDLVIADILPGPLSLLARFAPEAIRNADWRVQHPATGELRATGSVGGASLSVLISTRGRPTVNALRLIGEVGTAHADLFHGFAILERGAASRARKIIRPFSQGGAILSSATTNLLARAGRREPAYPGLRELIRKFYEAIGSSSPSPITAAETLDVAFARQNVLERA